MKFRENIGITLISLIVTIVLLLILAGATINSLTGSESAMEKASEAREKTNIANAKQQAELLILNLLQDYYNNKYSILDKSFDSAEKYISYQLQDGIIHGSYKILAINNYIIVIDEVSKNKIVGGTLLEDGIILWDSMTEYDLNKMIGVDVEYTNYLADYSDGWQLFYANDTEVFIISKKLTKRNWKIPLIGNNKSSKYSGSYDVSNFYYGNKWNSIWLSICEQEENTNNNAKIVAYLCDSENWSEYVAYPANYAIGGATLELLNESYKKYSNINLINNISETQIGYSGSSNLDLTSSYLITDGTYFLASPSGYDGNNLRRVSKDGEINNSVYYNYASNDYGVRPLVSIPISYITKNSDGTKLRVIYN